MRLIDSAQNIRRHLHPRQFSIYVYRPRGAILAGVHEETDVSLARLRRKVLEHVFNIPIQHAGVLPGVGG